MRCSTLLVALLLGSLPGRALAAWQTRDLAGVDTRVYTPSTVSPVGDGRALMVGLHGCNQTADQLMQHGNFEAAAEDFGVVIALPNVPGGGVLAGCWSYYGPVHSRTGGHSGPVIELAQALRDELKYAIDPAQIYLAGFSAGGGQAVVLGCLAPDLFAGVGVAAGPAVGTTGDQIARVGTTVEQAAALCEQLAGPHAGDFTTQLAVAFTDTSDFVVAQGYAELNAEMFAQLSAGGIDAMTAAPLDVASLPGAMPVGEGTTWADADGPRIAWIASSGVGHAWPAGSGSATGALAYVSGTGLNFSYVLAEFFAANNRRAGGDWMPGGDEGGSSDGDSDGGDSDGGNDAGAGSGGDADDDEASTGDDAGTSDAASGDAADDTSLSGPGADDRIEPTGCQCSTRPDALAFPGWLLLGLLGLTSRETRSTARRARACVARDRCAPARAGRDRPRP